MNEEVGVSEDDELGVSDEDTGAWDELSAALLEESALDEEIMEGAGVALLEEDSGVEEEAGVSLLDDAGVLEGVGDSLLEGAGLSLEEIADVPDDGVTVVGLAVSTVVVGSAVTVGVTREVTVTCAGVESVEITVVALGGEGVLMMVVVGRLASCAGMLADVVSPALARVATIVIAGSVAVLGFTVLLTIGSQAPAPSELPSCDTTVGWLLR